MGSIYREVLMNNRKTDMTGTLNFFVNDFWSHSNTSVMYDFKRYDFFQTLTVIGGLKLLLALGPGHMALDQKKDT